MEQLKCSYCGKVREKVMFIIGAARKDDVDWIMHEGTGKVSCTDADCRAKAEAEAKAVINSL